MNSFLLVLVMIVGNDHHEYVLDSGLSQFECEAVAVVDNFLYNPDLNYYCIKGV